MSETNPWKIINETVVYQNNWISLHHYNVLNPSGGEGIYGKVHFKNKAVGIVPIDAHGNTILVGQFRFTLNAYSWEIPEGGCPYEEDPLEAAKRELLEETGLIANKWQLIGTAHLSNSVSDEVAFYYVATELLKGEAQPEETEALQQKTVPLQKAFEMVADGAITDALSVVALQKLELLLLKNELSF